MPRSYQKKLNLRLIHLDKYYWQPNWIRPELLKWREIVSTLVEEDKWIIEGNYGSTFDIRFQRATMIIHFEIHPFICLYRAIKRTISTRDLVREDMAKGCSERLNLETYKYILSYPKKHNQKVYQSKKNFFSGELVVIKNDKDLENLYLKLKI